jgi:hypothetical protein
VWNRVHGSRSSRAGITLRTTAAPASVLIDISAVSCRGVDDSERRDPEQCPSHGFVFRSIGQGHRVIGPSRAGPHVARLCHTIHDPRLSVVLSLQRAANLATG